VGRAPFYQGKGDLSPHTGIIFPSGTLGWQKLLQEAEKSKLKRAMLKKSELW
jgi:hypothetical protein